MKRFAGRSFKISADLVALAQRDADEFEVESVVNHQWDDGELYFLIHWFGFEPEDRTWEPATALQDDIPKLLRRYVHEHQLVDGKYDCLRKHLGID